MRAVLIGVLAVAATLGPESPRGQYESLVKEYGAASQTAPRSPQPQEFAPRFFALAEAHPDDPAALDCCSGSRRNASSAPRPSGRWG
jgi:hypothetical protein